MEAGRFLAWERLAMSLSPLTTAFLYLLAFPGLTLAAEQAIVPQGKGSYTTQRPDAIASPPDEIYKTSDIKGAIPTNQWWSSLVWEPHSSNLFPHPLGMVCTEAGLSVSYPGAAIVSASGHIMGGGVSETGDLVIGLSGVDHFPSALLADYSQWFVTAEFAEGQAKLRTSFGHGSPFVYCRHSGGKPRIRLAEKPIVWSQSEDGDTIGLTVRGSHYGLFGAAGSRWNSTEGVVFTNDTAQDYFSVALLPDNQPSTLAMFSRYAHSHVVDTQVEFDSADGRLESSYRFTTKAMEGDTTGTIFALYPHQWKYSDAPLSGLSYRSVRGSMKIGRAMVLRPRCRSRGCSRCSRRKASPTTNACLATSERRRRP